MAKHHVFLHIGPGALALDEASIQQLAQIGVCLPALGQGDLDRADLEIRRAHKPAGLRRKDVEGAWAKVCRRTLRLRSDAFLSVPGLGAATDEQEALAIDVLHGVKVHLVVTADEPDLPPAWVGTVKTGRVHSVGADQSPSELADALVAVVLADRAVRVDRKLSRHSRRRRELRDQLVA